MAPGTQEAVSAPDFSSHRRRSRPCARRDFAWENARVIRRLKLLTKISELVSPKIALDVIKEDPPDNRILECAIAGKADLIVSGDRHLRQLKTYQGIPIVRPVDFLRTLGVGVTSR